MRVEEREREGGVRVWERKECSKETVRVMIWVRIKG